jgi:GT2 family glycosyltransferase
LFFNLRKFSYRKWGYCETQRRQIDEFDADPCPNTGSGANLMRSLTKLDDGSKARPGGVSEERNVSAVITTFNTWSLTERCVRALELHAAGYLKEIIVVDDFSDDVGPEYVRKSCTVRRNVKNLGYAKSANEGIRASSSDFVLLLDSDAEPISNLPALVAQVMETDSETGAIGFSLINSRGEPTANSSPEPTWWSFILGQRLAGIVESRLPNNRRQLLHSSAIGIRRKAFDSVGGFDEDYDFLDSDYAFSARLLNQGWRLAIEPLGVAIHEGTTSRLDIPAGGNPQTTHKRVLRFHKCRLLFLRKRYGPISRALVPILFFRHVLEIVTGLAIFSIGQRPSIIEKLKTRVVLARAVWRNYEIEQ